MTSRSKFSWDLYHKGPIIGIFRGLNENVIQSIARCFIEAELYTIEVTMNTKNAPQIISNLIEKYPTLNIGAGTVCNVKDLEIALESGAQFIVSPITDKEIIKNSVKKGIPVFPGAYTPTEIYKAWDLGASAVKVFPASQLGPKYIKDVLAPLDNLKLIPTGGVSIQNIKAYFEAGAFGVGMGSSLVNIELMINEEFEKAIDHLRKMKSLISDFI